MSNNLQCPYCAYEFEAAPKKSRKCPQCQKYIHRIKGHKKGAIHLLSEEDYRRKEQINANKRWIVLSKQVEEFSKDGDWQSLSQVYFQMALHLYKEGKEFFHVLQESARFQLLSFRELDIKRVHISVVGCSACMKQKDRIVSIEEALKEMPIPCKDCTTKIKGPASKIGWCRCTYITVRD